MSRNVPEPPFSYYLRNYQQAVGSQSMKSNTNDPPKEEVNLVGKGKGKNFKKQPSGNPKQGKKVFSKKKTPGNASVCMARKKDEVHLLEENCESSEESYHPYTVLMNFENLCMSKTFCEEINRIPYFVLFLSDGKIRPK